MGDDEPLCVKEFEGFFTSIGGSGVMMFMEGFDTAADGSVTMRLAFDDGDSFALRVPRDYPSADSADFAITSQATSVRMQRWLACMNEYMRRNKGVFKLSALLFEAINNYAHPSDVSQQQVTGSPGSSSLPSTPIGAITSGAADDSCAWEDDDDDDVMIGDDEYFTTQFEIQMDLERKKWRTKYEAMCAEKMQTSTSTAKIDSKEFFGVDDASFQILSSELTEFYREKPIPGTFVEPIGDDIYSWRVRMSEFPYEKPIAHQLTTLQENFDYNYVELQLDFAHQYPGYPPSLRVIRPRFAGSLVQSLALIDILKLSHWNPTNTARNVLQHIRNILTEHAVLDVRNRRNDRLLFPEGAHLPLDHLLIRLATLAEKRPRALTNIECDETPLAPPVHRLTNEEHERLLKRARDSPPEPIDTKRTKGEGETEKVAKGDKGTGWAKGTGYSSTERSLGLVGHRRQEGWNHKSYQEAQKQKDEEMVKLLQDIVTQMRDKHARESEDLFEVVEGSALLPFIESQLNDATFTELARHDSVFGSVLDLIDILREHPLLMSLLCRLKNQKHGSIASLLGNLAGAARHFFNMERHVSELRDRTAAQLLRGPTTCPGEITKLNSFKANTSSIDVEAASSQHMATSVGDSPSSHDWHSDALSAQLSGLNSLGGVVTLSTFMDDEFSEPSPTGDTYSSSIDVLTQIMHGELFAARQRKNQVLAEERQDDEILSRITKRIIETHDRVVECLENAGLDPNQLKTDEASDPLPNVSTSNETETMEADEVLNERERLERRYREELKSLQIRSDPDTINTAVHYYGKNVAPPSRAAFVRIHSDQQTLAKSLPLALASSVFVLYDENKINIMSALITGPEGTPYANGCFIFDVYFPGQYPQQAPQVNSRTNGGGTVRFNPNLYENGKVCLSLLGTWDGAAGEKWHPGTSTLLQVLVSIQSLILIDAPYFNEPGFERTRGTLEGDRANERYVQNIRVHTLKWAILEQIRHPYPGFEDVIRTHFRLKASDIVRQAYEWSEKNNACYAHAVAIEKELKTLGGDIELRAVDSERLKNSEKEQQNLRTRRSGMLSGMMPPEMISMIGGAHTSLASMMSASMSGGGASTSTTTSIGAKSKPNDGKVSPKK